MLGAIILILLLGTEIGFTVYCLLTKSYQKEKKSIAKIGIFLFLSVLVIISIIKWSFRWYLLFFLLFIKALIAVDYLIRSKGKIKKTFKRKYVMIACIGNLCFISLAVLPALIFPQSKPIMPTGKYEVGTVSYTLTDSNRLEAFLDNKDNRKVTIQFWYPKNANGKYPLTIFSHGAFGYRGSNRSTYVELASNGYVVCSIDHTYQAFVTKQTDGKSVFANKQFINDSMAVSNDKYDEKKTYELSHEWLKLRIDDVNFVLDDILNKTKKSDSDMVYHLINVDKIGLFGHSLGGATAAEVARERTDIDAVIVIDGTMLGEGIGYKNGKEILNKIPYPVPILNIYNEEHYKSALKHADSYANMVAAKNATDARNIVFKGAGHLNFTDLPIASPFLASLLGTGNINSRYCIQTMNQVVLKYFNYYLKDDKELELQEQY
ncbi:alpha/beta hydrolase family protein [Anaeromicropila herbilytica]|uniref:Carboxylic ester hydrolase n=1 Tax=Anaeromicropila herbilytica TaxID=2785025 RepID=A0A7R7ELH5_9FIRM|nr:dienelactone hydrolase family protein [Anaeromicropila herbilytica]BCN30796.1 carboxylic ester hydrolase [Anaeromicropila herbilytica]